MTEIESQVVVENGGANITNGEIGLNVSVESQDGSPNVNGVLENGVNKEPKLVPLKDKSGSVSPRSSRTRKSSMERLLDYYFNTLMHKDAGDSPPITTTTTTATTLTDKNHVIKGAHFHFSSSKEDKTTLHSNVNSENNGNQNKNLRRRIRTRSRCWSVCSDYSSENERETNNGLHLWNDRKSLVFRENQVEITGNFSSSEGDLQKVVTDNLLSVLEGNFTREDNKTHEMEDNTPSFISIEESIISNATSDETIDLNSSFDSNNTYDIPFDTSETFQPVDGASGMPLEQGSKTPFQSNELTSDLIPRTDFASLSNVSETFDKKRYSFGDFENEYTIECVSYTKSGELNGNNNIPRPITTTCTEKTYKFVFTRKICEPVFTFAKGNKVIEKTRSLIKQFENDSEPKIRKPKIDLDFINKEAEETENRERSPSNLRIDCKPHNTKQTPKINVERKAVDSSMVKRKQQIAEMIENVRQYLLKSPNVKHGTDRGAEICTANTEKKYIEEQRSEEKCYKKEVGKAVFNIRHAMNSEKLDCDDGELATKLQPTKTSLNESIKKCRTSLYPPLKAPVMGQIAERKAQLLYNYKHHNHNKLSDGSDEIPPINVFDELNYIKNNVSRVKGALEDKRRSLEILPNVDIHRLNELRQENRQLERELDRLSYVTVQQTLDKVVNASRPRRGVEHFIFDKQVERISSATVDDVLNRIINESTNKRHSLIYDNYDKYDKYDNYDKISAMSMVNEFEKKLNNRNLDNLDINDKDNTKMTKYPPKLIIDLDQLSDESESDSSDSKMTCAEPKSNTAKLISEIRRMRNNFEDTILCSENEDFTSSPRSNEETGLIEDDIDRLIWLTEQTIEEIFGKVENKKEEIKNINEENCMKIESNNEKENSPLDSYEYKLLLDCLGKKGDESGGNDTETKDNEDPNIVPENLQTIEDIKIDPLIERSNALYDLSEKRDSIIEQEIENLVSVLVNNILTEIRENPDKLGDSIMEEEFGKLEQALEEETGIVGEEDQLNTSDDRDDVFLERNGSFSSQGSFDSDCSNKSKPRRTSIYEQKHIKAPTIGRGNIISSRTENLFKNYERDMTSHEPRPMKNINEDNMVVNTDEEQKEIDKIRAEKEKELIEIRKQYQQRLIDEENERREARKIKVAAQEARRLKEMNEEPRYVIRKTSSTSKPPENNNNENGENSDGKPARKISVYKEKDVDVPVVSKGSDISSITQNLFKNYELDFQPPQKPKGKINIYEDEGRVAVREAVRPTGIKQHEQLELPAEYSDIIAARKEKLFQNYRRDFSYEAPKINIEEEIRQELEKEEKEVQRIRSASVGSRPSAPTRNPSTCGYGRDILLAKPEDEESAWPKKPTSPGGSAAFTRNRRIGPITSDNEDLETDKLFKIKKIHRENLLDQKRERFKSTDFDIPETTTASYFLNSQHEIVRRSPSAPLPSTKTPVNSSSDKKLIINDSIYVQAVVEAPTSVIGNVDSLSEKLNAYHQSVTEEKKQQAKQKIVDAVDKNADKTKHAFVDAVNTSADKEQHALIDAVKKPAEKTRFGFQQVNNEEELVEMKKIYDQIIKAEERERAEARRKAAEKGCKEPPILHDDEDVFVERKVSVQKKSIYASADLEPPKMQKMNDISSRTQSLFDNYEKDKVPSQRNVNTPQNLHKPLTRKIYKPPDLSSDVSNQESLKPAQPLFKETESVHGQNSERQKEHFEQKKETIEKSDIHHSKQREDHPDSEKLDRSRESELPKSSKPREEFSQIENSPKPMEYHPDTRQSVRPKDPRLSERNRTIEKWLNNQSSGISEPQFNIQISTRPKEKPTEVTKITKPVDIHLKENKQRETQFNVKAQISAKTIDSPFQEEKSSRPKEPLSEVQNFIAPPENMLGVKRSVKAKRDVDEVPSSHETKEDPTSLKDLKNQDESLIGPNEVYSETRSISANPTKINVTAQTLNEVEHFVLHPDFKRPSHDVIIEDESIKKPRVEENYQKENQKPLLAIEIEEDVIELMACSPLESGNDLYFALDQLQDDPISVVDVPTVESSAWEENSALVGHLQTPDAVEDIQTVDNHLSIERGPNPAFIDLSSPIENVEDISFDNFDSMPTKASTADDIKSPYKTIEWDERLKEIKRKYRDGLLEADRKRRETREARGQKMGYEEKYNTVTYEEDGDVFIERPPSSPSTSSRASISSTASVDDDGSGSGTTRQRRTSVYEQKQIQAPASMRGNVIATRTENLMKQYEKDLQAEERKGVIDLTEGAEQPDESNKKPEVQSIRMQYQRSLQEDVIGRRSSDNGIKTRKSLGNICEAAACGRNCEKCCNGRCKNVPSVLQRSRSLRDSTKKWQSNVKRRSYLFDPRKDKNSGHMKALIKKFDHMLGPLFSDGCETSI